MSPPWPPLHPLSQTHHTPRRTNFIRRRRQQLFTARTYAILLQISSPHALISTQSLTAMVRELRKVNSQTGLILANGGVLTNQHVLCLSRQPRQDGSNYPLRNPLPRYITDLPTPSVTAHAEGEAVIEVRSLSLSPPIPSFHNTHTPLQLTLSCYPRHTQ